MVHGDAAYTACENKSTCTGKSCRGNKAHDEIQILIEACGCKDFWGGNLGY